MLKPMQQKKMQKKLKVKQYKSHPFADNNIKICLKKEKDINESHRYCEKN